MLHGMLRKYSELLLRRPYTTNAISASFIAFAGDMLAQSFEWWNLRQESTLSGHTGSSSISFSPDLWRTARIACFGLLQGAPTIAWFRALERWFGSERRLGVIARKMLVQQLIYAPIANLCFFTYVQSSLHWRDGPQATAEHVQACLHREFLPAMMASSLVWPPVQLINFLYIPPAYRVLWGSGFGALWQSYMSFSGHRVAPRPALTTPVQ